MQRTIVVLRVLVIGALAIASTTISPSIAASAATPFPLGTYVGNPDGNNATAEYAFETQFASFSTAMNAAPTFMDGYIDPGQDPSQWPSNAQWTAWSWARSPVVGTNMTPVIGVPMAAASYSTWNGNIDTFFQAITSGQYDAAIQGVVDAWAGQGYSTVYYRLGYEMNCTCMAWYAGDYPEDWVAAFQHWAKVIKAEAQRIGVAAYIVWNPNGQGWTNIPTTNLYPGDEFVDVIGTDMYSPTYPNDFTDWALPCCTEMSNGTAWAAVDENRWHWWHWPSSDEWYPNGQLGIGWSVADMIALAQQHGKPIALGETGASGNGTTTGPVDEGVFPMWLAKMLSLAGVPVAFVNVWDVCMTDGCWDFTSTSVNKPNEKAAWAASFGAR